jgi:hypothetical protein
MTRSFVALALVAALTLPAGPADAHGPDPLLGTTPWEQNQVVEYMWAPGQEPPAWAASAIDAGAADSGTSRGSQAALFKRSDAAASRIAFGGPTRAPPMGSPA